MDEGPARDDIRLRAGRWRRGLLIASVAAFWTALALVASDAVGATATGTAQAPAPEIAPTPAGSGFFGDDGGAGGRHSRFGPPASAGDSGGSQAPILRSHGS